MPASSAFSAKSTGIVVFYLSNEMLFAVLFHHGLYSGDRGFTGAGNPIPQTDSTNSYSPAGSHHRTVIVNSLLRKILPQRIA